MKIWTEFRDRIFKSDVYVLGNKIFTEKDFHDYLNEAGQVLSKFIKGYSLYVIVDLEIDRPTKVQQRKTIWASIEEDLERFIDSKGESHSTLINDTLYLRGVFTFEDFSLMDQLDFIFSDVHTYTLLFSRDPLHKVDTDLKRQMSCLKDCCGKKLPSGDELTLTAITYEDEYDLKLTFGHNVQVEVDSLIRQTDSEQIFNILLRSDLYQAGDAISVNMIKGIDSINNFLFLREEERYLYVVDMASEDYECYRLEKEHIFDEWEFVGSLNEFIKKQN